MDMDDYDKECFDRIQRIAELEQQVAFLETYKHEAAFQAVQIAEREWLARVRELEAELARVRLWVQTASECWYSVEMCDPEESDAMNQLERWARENGDE